MNKALLISLALLLVISVGVVGCNGGATTYNLTLAVSPPGAGTTTPTGTTAQAPGAAVNIQAAAAAGYQFSHWSSAPAGTFGNASAPTTTFTMPAQAVTVTANFLPVYNLTLAVSPPGAGTTTPSGTTSRTAGAVINIQAAAAAPYQFSHWSAAPAGSFGNVGAPTTTFTMPAQNTAVTAHFVGPLDHFKWYFADSLEPVDEIVYLEDQFGAVNATVGYAGGFGNPAEKVHGQVTTPIWNPDHHLAAYYIDYEEDHGEWVVEVENQFGTQNLTVQGPIALAVPTKKEGHALPVGLDHYLIYEVIEGASVNVGVTLQDQFDDEPQQSTVYEPMYFANPVRKTHGNTVTEIQNPDAHLVFYAIDADFSAQVGVVNQFGQQNLDVYTFLGFGALAVPSEKMEWHKVVGHGTAYPVIGQQQYIGENVYLEDQFSAVNATVEYLRSFYNPAGKWHDGVESPLLYPDCHSLAYNITYEGEPGEWLVLVKNQFGIQELTVSGPWSMTAPAQKLEPFYHDPPVGLDHNLGYNVTAGDPVNEVVDLYDEFGDFTEVLVLQPYSLGNPARKTHDGNVTEILLADLCWVIYVLAPPYSPVYGVRTVDQFGEQTFDAFGPYLLSVPSQILYYERIS